MHWCLSVVDPVRRRLDYYDPTPITRDSDDNGTAIKNIEGYFNKEHNKLRQTPLVFQIERPACPEQRNTYDCGVFACQIANYLTSDVPLDFTEADMPMFRERLAADILQDLATAPASPPS